MDVAPRSTIEIFYENQIMRSTHLCRNHLGDQTVHSRWIEYRTDGERTVKHEKWPNSSFDQCKNCKSASQNIFYSVSLTK